MANFDGFSLTVPSDTSSAALGDDEFRSVKSYMQNWWEQEHYATDGSAGSAGVHKLGSGRAYSMTATSQLSNPTGDNDGRFGWVSADNSLWVADGSNSTWTQVTTGITLASVNTWTSLQNFSSEISTNDVNVAGSFDGIVSGSTTLAAAVGVSDGNSAILRMVNTSSLLTASDVIVMGSETSTGAGTAHIIVQGNVASDGSIDVTLLHAGTTSSNQTLNSGTVIRYLGFRGV